MKRFAVLLLLLAACKQEPEMKATPGNVDMRDPVEVLYVVAPEATVRAKADETSEVLATYQNGEAVSVLAKQGHRSEVRTGHASGWVRTEHLGSAQEKQVAEDNPEPKFKVMPLPVSAPSAQGEIYIEADVNSDGEVLTVRLITNTTGSPALAAQNADALRSARFHPIVVKGERKPFKYYHRVTY